MRLWFTVRSNTDESTRWKRWRVSWRRRHCVLNGDAFPSCSFDPSAPNIYSGNFTVTDSSTADTFLLPMTMPNQYWQKGVAYINNYNLGRYWPVMGPQVTLYVPGPWLKPAASNALTLIELQSSPCGTQPTCSIELVDYSILDKPTLEEAPVLFKRPSGFHWEQSSAFYALLFTFCSTFPSIWSVIDVFFADSFVRLDLWTMRDFSDAFSSRYTKYTRTKVKETKFQRDSLCIR